MPLHKTKRIVHPQHFALVRELIEEWKSPKTYKTAEPVIHVADPGGREPVNVYVVWSKWHGIPGTTRSDVILDAFEEVNGRGEVTRVAVAIGLTPDEAKDFGLEDADEDVTE